MKFLKIFYNPRSKLNTIIMADSDGPNVVGIQVLKQNGVDVDELVKLLIYLR